LTKLQFLLCEQKINHKKNKKLSEKNYICGQSFTKDKNKHILTITYLLNPKSTKQWSHLRFVSETTNWRESFWSQRSRSCSSGTRTQRREIHRPGFPSFHIFLPLSVARARVRFQFDLRPRWPPLQMLTHYIIASN
jgi:hypothetical protein